MKQVTAPAVAPAFPDMKARADATNDAWGWAAQGTIEEQLPLPATRPTRGDGGLAF